MHGGRSIVEYRSISEDHLIVEYRSIYEDHLIVGYQTIYEGHLIVEIRRFEGLKKKKSHQSRPGRVPPLSTCS